MEHCDSKAKDSSPCGLASAVDLQHLRYAIAAADHGSFRRAADALCLRQSTLSRCVRQLEERIKIAVFERSSGGVRATRSGREFLSTARSIVEQMDLLVRNAHNAGQGEAGRLAIGLYTSLSTGNLRATLVKYAQSFPEIEIGIIEGSRTRLVRALHNGALDIAVVTGEAPLFDSRMVTLWSERIVLALPEQHRLTSSKNICWSDLKNEKLLITRHDPGPEIHDLLATKLAMAAEFPRFVYYDVSRGTLKSLVSAGIGISLMTESCQGSNVAGLVYREIFDDAEETQLDYTAHWRADNKNPALDNFLKLLGERYSLPPSSA